VPEFLVEMYVTRDGAQTVAQATKRARTAADALTQDGTGVSHLRSIFVPRDETCFLLFEAETIDVVRAVAVLAELPFDRVSEAFTAAALPKRRK
jgi:Nickel responsive protein SCO4226-like